MHIIFGKENILELDTKYTILELDTVRIMPNGKESTAYCLVENIPIIQLSKVSKMKELHENLLINYKKKHWEYCEEVIQNLIGFWGGEVDTFYSEMQHRIYKYKEQDPGDAWDGIYEKRLIGVQPI